VAIVSSQSFAAGEDTTLSATIQTNATAGATLTVEQTSQPAKGTVTAFAANGSFTYQPNPDVSGTDTFTVRATDSAGKNGTATITLNIASVNDNPVAANDRFVLASASTIDLDVLANDSDVEGDALSVELVSAAAGELPNPEVGTAQVAANQHIVVSLPPDFRGVTRVRYRAKDQAGGMSEVFTAVAFVGTQPFETWYSVDGIVYANDLFVARQITNFGAPSRSGKVKFSTNKSVAVIEEVMDNRITGLHAVSTQSVGAPQPVTQALAADENIFTYVVNSDGSWIAYVVDKTNGPRTIWLVEREAPAERQAIVLPGSFAYIEDSQISPMTFNAAGDALYFVAQSDNLTERLYRASVADPAQPTAIIADADPLFISQVGAFFVAPAETHLVANMDISLHSGLYRVSLPNPTQLTLLSPAEGLRSIVTNNDVTRVAYATTGGSGYTDDRVFIADVSTTSNWREFVAADASRTGALLPVQVRPDGNAILLEDSSGVDSEFQVDIAEALGDGSSSVISVPAALGESVISQRAIYDATGDSVIYHRVSNSGPWRLIETRRGAFDQPQDLQTPGHMYAPVFSTDMTVLATVHNRNAPEDSIFRVRLVNRSAPGAMIDLTSGPAIPIEIGVHGVVEEL
jgi:Tol biopolymer transport system component